MAGAFQALAHLKKILFIYSLFQSQQSSVEANGRSRIHGCTMITNFQEGINFIAFSGEGIKQPVIFTKPD